MKPGFVEGIFTHRYGDGDSYKTPRKASKRMARILPSLYFYSRIFLGPFRWLGKRAARSRCDDAAWVFSSAWCGDILEDCGGSLDISGQKYFSSASGPFVFIANHMSTLETFFLPGIVRPFLPITFVIKKSLVSIPLFGPIMRSRDPIIVERKNPREDLRAVLEGGVDRLKKGISVIVFPQSTRQSSFDRGHFNTIGIKLARAAGVPVIPLVLKTDAWGQGRPIKELGKMRPELPVRFKFDEPLTISGNGKAEHARICDFIEKNLLEWQIKDGVAI